VPKCGNELHLVWSSRPGQNLLNNERASIGYTVFAGVLILCTPLPAVADPAPTELLATTASTGLSDELAAVTVTADRLRLIGTATTASEGVVVNDELALLPVYRPGQLLETIPGLDVTSHSGEGKANQYLMRGYNLDHGTDLATFVDGMPVNEPTHAHGQGYTDVNFLIPELATNIGYTKGTSHADEGDFASVGSIHINYLDSISDQMRVMRNPGLGVFAPVRVLLAGLRNRRCEIPNLRGYA